ncbi:MAG: tetratricopeptide repeat protein [Acidimicrobiales bacterium]
MSAVGELQAHLDRYPADRYPVQHATARFHLGVALAGEYRLDEAEASLARACELFRPDQLPTEHAKAANALGAVQRMSGQHDAAAASFRTAADLFAGAALPLEQGAALFNLGLVERGRGGAGAIAAFEQAQALLDPARVPGQAAAAARELGAALLAADRPDDAVAPLTDAIELAARAEDRAGLGGAANALGLAHLAAGRPDQAVLALEQAVAANPRSVRPDAYAMAKANLALALEAAGRVARARLAALQALGSPSVPEPVRAQATDVVGRVGADAGAVWAVLDEAPQERWAAVVREEVIRWEAGLESGRRSECAAWITGQLDRPRVAEELAEAYLAALIELPPTSFDVMVHSTVAALLDFAVASQERFATQCSRALARFPVPQLLRLKDTFSAAAADAGLAAGTW